MDDLGLNSNPRITYGRAVPDDRWSTENGLSITASHGDPAVVTTDAFGVLWVRPLAIDPNSGNLFPAITTDVRRQYATPGSSPAPAPISAMFGYGWNGSDLNATDFWDRIVTASILNNQSTEGIVQHALALQWSEHDAAAANAQPVATRAAAGAGVANVCTSIHATLVGAVASATALTLQLLDGAVVIWESHIFLPAAGGTVELSQTGLEIPGTANTAMILRLSAVTGAAVSGSVAMTGHVIS